MTVQKGFFENYRGGHDVWADMTTENTVYGIYIFRMLIINLTVFLRRDNLILDKKNKPKRITRYIKMEDK